MLQLASQQLHKYLIITSLALQNNFTFTASSKLHSKFTATLHSIACLNFTTTTLVLHCCFTNLYNNFTCTSLFSLELYFYFTELHINFTCISLLLYMRFIVAYYLHHMHFNCTSLLLHSTSQHCHMYFTVAALEIHSNIYALLLYFTVDFTTSLHAFHCCFPCAYQQVHTNITWKSQQLYMYFTTASLALLSILTVRMLLHGKHQSHSQWWYFWKKKRTV